MNSNLRNLNNKDKILCKFFLQGNCKNGAQCAWLHDEEKKKEWTNKSGSGPPSNPTPVEKNPQPCFFYFSGNCTKGDVCPYSHELLFDDEETDPDDTPEKTERKVDAVAVLLDKTMRQLIEDSKDKECSICFDGVVSQKRLFGLLSSCDHVYCLDCIRNWRATDQHDADKPVESVSHTCPMCRQLSLFVVPSPVHATGQIKTKITSRYLQRLKQIPCKYFKYGTGYCPFNAACFYAHLNKDGTVATLAQNLRNKPHTRRRPGFLIDGQQPFMMSTRLLEMIMPFLSDNVRSQILAYSIDEEDEELFDEDDADVMSRDDDDSDSMDMDYTHESDNSDDAESDARSRSGSDSNNMSSVSHGLDYTTSYHNRSYAYYDSDSDAPERQLYDGNDDPDGADEVSSDSSIGVKYEQQDGSVDSSDSDNISGSEESSFDMSSDSSIEVPAVDSDSISHEDDVSLSASNSLLDESGSSAQHESLSSMSDAHDSESDDSSVQYEDSASDGCNADSNDYGSD